MPCSSLITSQNCKILNKSPPIQSRRRLDFSILKASPAPTVRAGWGAVSGPVIGRSATRSLLKGSRTSQTAKTAHCSTSRGGYYSNANAAKMGARVGLSIQLQQQLVSRQPKTVKILFKENIKLHFRRTEWFYILNHDTLPITMAAVAKDIGEYKPLTSSSTLTNRAYQRQQRCVVLPSNNKYSNWTTFSRQKPTCILIHV